MIKRIYVNNFRCLQNFEYKSNDKNSSIFIGRNGVGKSTFGDVLALFRGIGQGVGKVSDLIRVDDFNFLDNEKTIRFELDVSLKKSTAIYKISFDWPPNFKSARVTEESLEIDGQLVFKRSLGEVSITRGGKTKGTGFMLDWHVVALPIIQAQGEKDNLHLFKKALENIIILNPNPSFIDGYSDGNYAYIKKDASNFVESLSDLLIHYPSSYQDIYIYIKEIIPDLVNFVNKPVGGESKRLVINFSGSDGNVSLPFDRLSDGEKCLFLSAYIIASNNHIGPLICFWDEPSNYLAPSEVAFLISALRRAFAERGQIFLSSHSIDAILSFDDESTVIFDRKGHSEPTQISTVAEWKERVAFDGDFATTIRLGDIGL